MAKRIVVVLLVVMMVLLLLPALGMATVMATCPACPVPNSAPIGTMCLAILGLAIVLIAASVRRALAPILAAQPTGPPDPRLFRPPRSS